MLRYQKGYICNMTLNQTVTRKPLTVGAPMEEDKDGKSRPTMTGRVVYIHPQGRYHVVEFEIPGGVVRESFAGVGE